MVYCKAALTPVHQQWSYCSLVPSHQDVNTLSYGKTLPFITKDIIIFTPLYLIYYAKFLLWSTICSLDYHHIFPTASQRAIAAGWDILLITGRDVQQDSLANWCCLASLTLSQWSSSGNPVAIQCAWNLNPSVHWNATGEMPVCFQWSSSVFQLCKLTLYRHWDTTGWKHQPVWFQWHPSVLVAPVVFQCVPIMQINTGLPLEHHWVQASASVVPVASQCTCGSSGLPVCSNYAN